MQLLGILLLLLNTNMLLAQSGILDTIWNLTDKNKVYIKAPKNVTITRIYAENTLCKSKTDPANAIFTYNNLHWETDSFVIDIRVHYRGSSINVRNYKEKIEKDTMLTEAEKCSLVSERINYSYGNSLEKILADHSLTQPIKIRGLYYYLDAMGTLIEKDRVVKKFLFIPYYKKVYKSISYIERYIFIDSVVYCFTITSKKENKGIRAWKWQQRAKNIEKVKPAFYDLVNSIIFKEEEAKELIKKEE